MNSKTRIRKLKEKQRTGLQVDLKHLLLGALLLSLFIISDLLFGIFLLTIITIGVGAGAYLAIRGRFRNPSIEEEDWWGKDTFTIERSKYTKEKLENVIEEVEKLSGTELSVKVIENEREVETDDATDPEYWEKYEPALTLKSSKGVIFDEFQYLKAEGFACELNKLLKKNGSNYYFYKVKNGNSKKIVLLSNSRDLNNLEEKYSTTIEKVKKDNKE